MKKNFFRFLSLTIITSLFINSFVIIDGMFIGSKLGDVGLSAINLSWPITAFLQSIGVALGISAGIYISRLKGLGNIEEANKAKSGILILILITSIVLGILFFIFAKPLLILFGAEGDALKYSLDYIKIILLGAPFELLGMSMPQLLKNSDKIKSATFASIIEIIINLILDYIFILVFDFNLWGAALASVISLIGATIICFIFYYKELEKPYIDKKIIKYLYLSSISPFILNYSYAFILIITNYLCVKFGGNEAVAAYTLLSYLLYIIGATAQASGDAIQPLYSFNSANGSHKINHQMLSGSLLFSFILCGLFVALFYIFSNNLEDLYNLSSVARVYYNDGLIYYLIGFLLTALTKPVCSYLYSVGDRLRSNLLTILEPLILTPLFYLILCPGLKLNGLWMTYLFAQIGVLIASTFFIIRNIRREKLWTDL